MDSVSTLMRNVFLHENVLKNGSGNDEAFNRAVGRMDSSKDSELTRARQE